MTTAHFEPGMIVYVKRRSDHTWLPAQVVGRPTPDTRNVRRIDGKTLTYGVKRLRITPPYTGNPTGAKDEIPS